jgi:hypothetical protein
MDFFLVIAAFIFLFTFLFYVQYVQKANKYNSTNKKLQTANVEASTLKEQVDKMDKENASQMEKNYNTAYNELSSISSVVSKYSDYIFDIYEAKKGLPGVTINGVEVVMEESKITLTLAFDKTDDYQVDYRYRAKLLDYKWIPKDGIKYSDTSQVTKWEVSVDDGTTTKK